MPAKVTPLEVRKPRRKERSREEIDRFIHQETNAQSVKVRAVRRMKKETGIVCRTSGETRRRTTVYFPPELVHQLKQLCLDAGTDMSDVVTEALQKHLEPHDLSVVS